MKQRHVVEVISVRADQVAVQPEDYNSDGALHGIYFGEGDPEEDGQHWNFGRMLGDDDDGVCTVKEIQQVTVYGGIAEFVMDRSHLICKFEEKTAQQTGVRRLEIAYQIDDDMWRELAGEARLVFQGQDYFRLKE